MAQQSLLKRWGYPGTTLVALAALLLWAPIPLGSNRPWAVGVLCMAMAALFARAALRPGTWDAARSTNKATPDKLAWGRWGLAAVLAAQVLLVAAQWWAGISADGSAVVQTMDAESTRRYLLVALSLLLAWCVVAWRVRTTAHARFVLGAILAAGVLQTVLAALFLGMDGGIYWFHALLGGEDRATGTFHNSDHFAGFLELALSAGFGLLIAQLARAAGKDEPARHAVHAALRFSLSGRMIVRLMLVALVMGLVLTRSRMGNLAFVLALVWVSAMVAWRSRTLRRPALWLLASMLAIDVLIVGQWVGLGKVVDRVKNTANSTAIHAQAEGGGWVLEGRKPLREQSVQERLEIPRRSLRLVDEHLMLGAGGGSFYLALPAIKPAGFPELWDHAHNDYVEIAVDTGLVGLALVLAVGLATYGRALTLLGDGTTPTVRGLGVAALTALTSLGLHALVDFNLQIPANALTLTVLCALVWCIPRPEREHGAASSRKLQRAAATEAAKKWHLPWALAAVLPLAAWVAWPLVSADLITQTSRLEIADCQRLYPQWKGDDWERLEFDMQAGLEQLPDSALLYSMLGTLYSCQGAAHWADEKARTVAYGKAEEAFEASLRLRPSHAATWSGLALARYFVGRAPDAVQLAWSSALLAGPNERPVQESMFDLVLLAWDSATPDMKQWLEQKVITVDDGTRRVMLSHAERLKRPTVVETILRQSGRLVAIDARSPSGTEAMSQDRRSGNQPGRTGGDTPQNGPQSSR